MTLSGNCRDYAGKVIGWLTVIYPLRYDPIRKSVVWLCRCKCSALVELTAKQIASGRTHSCGKCGYKQHVMFERNALKLAGKRYGRLTVLEPTARRSGNSVVWKCKCDCGKICYVSVDQLQKGETVSCGCYHLEQVTKYHSEIEHQLADRWHRIQQRCYNPKDKNYPHWGGRGIKMCDEWLNNKRSFIEWGIKTGFRRELEIDRIDGTKGYSPDNCRWVDDKEQAVNRLNVIPITVNGVTRTCIDWDRRLGKIEGYTWTYRNRKGEEAVKKMIEMRLAGTWVDNTNIDDIEILAAL